MRSIAILLVVMAIVGVAGHSMAAVTPPVTANADADRGLPVGTVSGLPAPAAATKDGLGAAQVWVDDNYTSGGYNDGHTWGADAFSAIQSGIDAVDPGGTVYVAAGTYRENLTITKALTLDGAGQDGTFIYPLSSDIGGCGGPSLGNSQVIVVTASDVTIGNLTIDGDNPDNGAGIDARNGIIEGGSTAYDNLAVHDVTVRNIYLRGIYARSGGSGFHFSHNTVDNVAGCSASVAIFNFGGSGVIEYNTVRNSNDAISSNWSRGTQYLHNLVQNCGSGIHTDNNGGSGGSPDLIQNNTIEDSAANGYGIFVFFPYLTPTVDLNTVTNVDVGLFAWGGSGGAGQFTNNTVDAESRPGSIGIYVTPGPDSWGSWQADVAASFSGNSVSNAAYGFFVETDEADPFFSTTIAVSGHTETGNAIDIGVAGLGAFSVTGLSGDTVEVGHPGKIQLGVDLANPAGSVRVVAGAYSENVVIGKSLTLHSTAGRSATTIEGVMAGAELGTIQVAPGVNDLTIGGAGEGFTIIGIEGSPGLEKAAIYFQLAHANVVVRDNEIRANGDAGLMTEYNAVISNFTIDGNTFSGQTFLGTTPAGLGFAEQFTLPNVPRQLVVMGGGAGGTNGSGVSFTNNLVTGAAGGLNGDGLEQGNTLVTIDTDNSTFTGNAFTGVTTRYATSLRCRRPGAGIAGNTFSTAGLGSLCGHLMLQNNAITDALVAANTFDRACYLESPAGGTIGFHIGAAAAPAPADAILKVLPGNYTENAQISVARNLSIIGIGDAGRAILQTTKNTTAGGNVPSEAWIYNPDGVSLTLKNLVLDGAGASINHAVQSRGTLTVEDCAIRNVRYGPYNGRGIVLFAGAANAIRRTTFANIERIGIHVRGNVATPLPVAAIEQITYTGKGAGDWLDYGVEFGGGGSGSVADVVISNCVGVALTDSSTSAGILATDYFGSGTSATITGSVFGNCSSGITVGYAPEDLTTVTATGCNFASCDTGIIATHTTELLVSAHDDWWGDATGPLDASDDRATGGLYNPGGLGVPVTDGVDYDPWNLGSLSAIPDEPTIGSVTRLGGVRMVPNPLAGRGEVRFALSASAPVSVALFEVTGRLVWLSSAQIMPAGAHAVSLDVRDVGGRSLPAGAYLCRVQAGTVRAVSRVIVVR